MSHTRDRRYELFRALGSASCDITRDKRYDLLRALGSASGDISHETGGTICCEHWSLRLVISQTKQGVRFVTVIGFCFL